MRMRARMHIGAAVSRIELIFNRQDQVRMFIYRI